VAVNGLFRREITGNVLDAAQNALNASGPLVQALEETVREAAAGIRGEVSA
jgi:hypothetical protein